MVFRNKDLSFGSSHSSRPSMTIKIGREARRRAGDKFNREKGMKIRFSSCDWNDCLGLLASWATTCGWNLGMAWAIWRASVGMSDLMEFLFLLDLLKEKQTANRSSDLKWAIREWASADLPVPGSPVSQQTNGVGSVVVHSERRRTTALRVPGWHPGSSSISKGLQPTPVFNESSSRASAD